MSPVSSRNLQLRRARCAALTLIELLVVLSLVAVLSTVALRSVVGVFEEKQYDANIEQLEAIKEAVLGVDGQGGFVRDIGRLPVAIGDADYDPDPAVGNHVQLSELWMQGALPSYQMGSPDGDPEVRLSAGWRGPYLNLGFTRSTITDSFANVFHAMQADGTTSNDEDPIAIVLSPGSNGTIDPDDTGIDQDIPVFFQAEKDVIDTDFPPQDTNRWETGLQINIDRSDGQHFTVSGERYLIIRIYGAVDGAVGTSRQRVVDLELLDQDENGTLNEDDSPTIPGLDEQPPWTETLSFSVTVPHGSKAIRIYQANSQPASLDEQIGSPVRITPIKYIIVNQFTESPISLTLDTPDPD